MPTPATRFATALLASLALELTAGALAAQTPPAAAAGLQLVPTRPGGQPLEVTECFRHAVPADGGGFEEIQPCSERLAPAEAARLVWLEAEGWMSPARHWIPRGPLDAGQLPMPMVGAGKLTWSAAARQEAAFSGESLQLYLLHLESHLKALDDTVWEMARWATLAEAEKGIPMPTGQVVALVFDEASGVLLAMSKPQEIAARRSTELVVSRPDPAKSHLFLELLRPNPVARKDYRKTAAELDWGEAPRAANVLVATQRQILALFYDLPPKRCQLDAEAANARLEDLGLRLEAGKVLYEQARLTALPSLKVQIELPMSLRGLPLAVEVLGENQQPLRRVELPATARETTIDLLPAVQTEVLLQATPYVFRQPADLTRGDHQVMFAPQPLTVRGTVFRGEEASAASVVFTNLQDNATGFTVETDDQGHYETTFWKSGPYQAAIHFNAELPPYTEEVEVADRTDQILDLHAPGLHLQLRVIDATSGEAITHAVVYLRHHPFHGGMEEQDFAAEGEIIDLPPFDAGRLEIAAAAEGYLRSATVAVDVGAAREPEPIEIALTRATAARKIWLRDVNGRAVRGALARAQFDLGNGVPLWEGYSDQEGHLEIPQEALGSFLLVRAEDQAASVRHLDKESLSQAEDPIVFILMPGSPLQLKVLGLGQEGRSAAIALWLDGQRLSDSALAFFCGQSASDGEGLFSCSVPMPTIPLQVVAWDPSQKPPDFAAFPTTLPAIRNERLEIPLNE